jgi:hypothetical protein
MAVAKEDLKEWSRRWREYNAWAEANAGPDPRTPQQIMSDLELLYRNVPEELRLRDPDPEKLGIQNLHRILRRLSETDER